MPEYRQRECKHHHPIHHEHVRAITNMYGLYRRPKPSLEGLQLERMTRLLADLGNPHHYLPPTFHIAGTNGKGSTLSACRFILSTMGYRVHAFSSPHLVHPKERFCINNQDISETVLWDAMQHVHHYADPQHYSFFEFFTAVGFYLFSQHPADYLILETGLGGRLDATNVIQNPTATLITPIDYDHQDYLGSTLTQIAHEKSGILKPNCPAIIGYQQPEALNVLLKAAQTLQVSTIIAGRDWHVVDQENEYFDFIMNDETWRLPYPSLPGKHQLMNAGLAIAAIKTILPFAQSTNSSVIQSVGRGLQSMSWPARLQRIKQGFYHDMLGSTLELWVDGAHNPHGMQAISEFFVPKINQNRLWVVMACLKNRDAASLLEPLIKLQPQIVGVSLCDPDRCHPADHITQTAQSQGLKGVATQTIHDAISWIKTQSQPGDIVLCTGSLYLAGEFLDQNLNTT